MLSLLLAGLLYVRGSAISQTMDSTPNLGTPPIRSKDLRMVEFWAKPDPKKRRPIDPKALKFVSDLSSQPTPATAFNPNAHRPISAEWNEFTGRFSHLNLDWEFEFELLPHESNMDQSKRFILAHPELFQLSELALNSFTVSIDHMGTAESVIYEQHFSDYPTYLPLRIGFHYGKPGKFLDIGANYFAYDKPVRNKPRLTPVVALRAIRSQLPNLWKTWDGQPIRDEFKPVAENDPFGFPLPVKGNSDRTEPLFHIRHVGMDFTDDLDTRLVYFLFGGDLRLSWFFSRNWRAPMIHGSDRGQHINRVDIVVDAENGQVLTASVQSAEQSVVN
jgi:hypothetical protein